MGSKWDPSYHAEWIYDYFELTCIGYKSRNRGLLCPWMKAMPKDWLGAPGLKRKGMDKTNEFPEHVDMEHRTRKHVEIFLRPQSRTLQGTKGLFSVWWNRIFVLNPNPQRLQSRRYQFRLAERNIHRTHEQCTKSVENSWCWWRMSSWILFMYSCIINEITDHCLMSSSMHSVSSQQEQLIYVVVYNPITSTPSKRHEYTPCVKEEGSNAKGRVKPGGTVHALSTSSPQNCEESLTNP